MRSCFVSLTHTTPTFPLPPHPPPAPQPQTLASFFSSYSCKCMGQPRARRRARVRDGRRFVRGWRMQGCDGGCCWGRCEGGAEELERRCGVYQQARCVVCVHTLVACVHTRLAGGVRLSAAGAAQLRIDVLQLQQVCCSQCSRAFPALFTHGMCAGVYDRAACRVPCSVFCIERVGDGAGCG